MGLMPNPEGEQTRHPFNCLGKKISVVMAVSQGHTDLHCDNSNLILSTRQKLHSFVKTFHTVQQLATQSNNKQETV